MAGKKWIRVQHGAIAGVCGGIARLLGISAFWVRLVWLLGTLFYGLSIWTYLVLWWLVPREDHQYEPDHPMILGVCMRLAQRFNVEVSVVRIITVLSPIPTAGVTILVYIALNFLLPEEKTTS